MKILSYICVLSLLVMAGGCKEDRLVVNYKEFISKNTYLITYFETASIIKTQNYTNFSLTFLEDGKLAAKVGALEYKGNWDIFTDIDRETEQKIYRIEIILTGTAELDEISHKWLIVSLNSDYIQLGLPESVDKDKLNLTKIE